MAATNGKPTWTVMVYISADSILTNFAVESLKQLRDAANENIKVAALFDTPEQDAMCYIFDKKSRGKSLNGDGIKKYPLNPDEIADDPDTLTHFINWSYRECPSDFYALVMWGHGPELLFEAPTGTQNGAGKRLYFTPIQLASALRKADKQIHIIGFDACSMSMIEFANELSQLKKVGRADALVDWMIASQREVPDLSFPYRTVVPKLGETKEPANCCRTIVDRYVDSYRDYICDASTGAEPVTLAAVNLKNVETITGKIRDLVKEMALSAPDKKAGHAIYQARKEAQGFVGGLFVDLCDFSDRLQDEAGEIPQKLYDAAAALSVAIRDHNEDTGCVVVNEGVQSSECHGLSLYFPYLRDGDERKKVEQPLAKGAGGVLDGKGAGGVLDGKGAGGVLDGKNILNAAAANVRYAVRRDIIKDTETYYKDPDFQFAQATGWYQFIARDWSRILAEKEPGNLDVRYSAQQCVRNLMATASSSNPGGTPSNSTPVVVGHQLSNVGALSGSPDLTIETNGEALTAVLVAVHSNGR